MENKTRYKKTITKGEFEYVLNCAEIDADGNLVVRANGQLWHFALLSGNEHILVNWGNSQLYPELGILIHNEIFYREYSINLEEYFVMSDYVMSYKNNTVFTKKGKEFHLSTYGENWSKDRWVVERKIEERRRAAQQGD